MILLAANDQVVMLLVAVMAISASVLVVRARRHFAQYSRRSGAAASELPTPAAEDRRRTEAPDDVANWEVEMHDTARRLTAQLDSKMVALQTLIAEADRAAARLEAAIGQYRPSAGKTSQAEGLLSPTAGNGAAEEASMSDSADGAQRTRRQDEIYTLADYGYSPVEIARRVGSPIGEVELILGLRAKN